MTVQATSRRKRSTKAEQREEMIRQILDAAEFLFSKHGLHGVTLKDVAKHVGVHHTLINYYFDDKKALFDTVFTRRAVVTSERRACDRGVALVTEESLVLRDPRTLG